MWLADGPALFERLFGAPSERFEVGDLPSGDRDLWRALSPAVTVHGRPAPAGDFWRHVHIVDTAPTSQYDVLGSPALAGVPLEGPAACLALSGRDFHGHRGRPWSARRGNLHLSAAIPSHMPAAACGLALTMLPAVAVVDAVSSVTEGRLVPGIKWVNDLLAGDGKVAGVLTSTQSRGGTVERVVVGIGLNVTATPDIVPTPFVPRASSLTEASGDTRIDLPTILKPILTSLAVRYAEIDRAGPDSLFAIYRRHSLVPGRAVRIWDEGPDPDLEGSAWPDPRRRGVVLDMAPDLSLGLDDGGARVRRGRLAFEEDCRALGI